MTRLEDRAEIEDCLHRYVRYVDRLDYDSIPRCYHPGAKDTHGSYSGDIAGLVEDIRTRHSAYESSQHFIMNVLIDFYGEDLAQAESYCLCYFRSRREPGKQTQTQRISRCRYVDRFERRDGRWAITERVVVFDETTAQEITDIRKPDWVAASRDHADPLYTWFAWPEAGADAQMG